MKIYIVMLEGWIMPFESIPDERCFNFKAKLFEINGNFSLSDLPEIFSNGFKHEAIKDITKSWKY